MERLIWDQEVVSPNLATPIQPVGVSGDPLSCLLAYSESKTLEIFRQCQNGNMSSNAVFGEIRKT